MLDMRLFDFSHTEKMLKPVRNWCCFNSGKEGDKTYITDTRILGVWGVPFRRASPHLHLLFPTETDLADGVWGQGGTCPVWLYPFHFI
jgi:hypothetical protein